MGSVGGNGPAAPGAAPPAEASPAAADPGDPAGGITGIVGEAENGVFRTYVSEDYLLKPLC